MSKTDNGGPAFPGESQAFLVERGVEPPTVDGAVVTFGAGTAPPMRFTHKHPGATLRDYFAAAAVTGLLAGEGNGGVYSDYKGRTRYENIAQEAALIADAMLEARQQ